MRCCVKSCVCFLRDVNPSLGCVTGDLEAEVVLSPFSERESVGKPCCDVVGSFLVANDEDVVDVYEHKDTAPDVVVEA